MCEYSGLEQFELDFDRQSIFLLSLLTVLFSGHCSDDCICGKYIAIILWCVYRQQYWLPNDHSIRGTFLWLRPKDQYISDKCSLWASLGSCFQLLLVTYPPLANATKLQNSCFDNLLRCIDVNLNQLQNKSLKLGSYWETISRNS